MFCEQCQVWELIEGDFYCSWCGTEVFQLKVRERPIRLYIDPQNPTASNGTSDQPVIENLSHAPLTLSCEGVPPWLSINPSQLISVEPNSSLNLAMIVDVQKLGGVFIKEGNLVFRKSTANLQMSSSFEPVQISVQLWEIPQIKIQPLTVFSGHPSSQAELSMEVWSPVFIEHIGFDPPHLVYDGKLPLDLDISDNHTLPVRLNLPQQLSSAKESVIFKIKVEGLEEPVTGQFDLLVKKPAALDITEPEDVDQAGYQLIPETEEEIELILNNRGEETLKIEGISISLKGATGQTAVTVKAEKDRFQIEPNNKTSLRFKALACAEAMTGDYWFEIAFNSNDPNPQRNKYNLLVKVVDDRYQSFIALDFGTTDSAVAIFGPKNRQPVNIPLEKGVDERKIYSNIFFKSYNEERDPPYAWCIGNEAKSLAIATRERFVKAIKTKAGTLYKETIPFKNQGISRDIDPEEIIRFIMMDLLKRTRLALRKKPAKFILTVPTRFTLRRKEILKETFLRAAKAVSLDLEVEIIDESLAAGLFYILIRGPKDEVIRNKESYTMMILDFGGGTTDNTVFKVQQQLHSDGTVKAIEIIEVLGAWGDATLGGEGITTDIAQVLASKFLARNADAEKDKLEIRKLEDEAEAAKLVISELESLRRSNNELVVDEIVEQASRSLRDNLAYLSVVVSPLNDAELRDKFNFYLNNDSHIQVQSADFRGQTVTLAAQEVIEIFAKKLNKLKKELELLLRRINEPQIDVLLLAGQSSQFPTVAETFKGLARNIDFVKDPKNDLVLKECVSLGALYYSFCLKGDVEWKIIGADKLWTRLGRDKFSIGMDETSFDELIPWGSQYPLESEPFFLTRYDVSGNKLILKIEENLSMSDSLFLEPFGSFELNLGRISQNKYTCKLKVNDKGEIEAFCHLQNRWRKMEFSL